MAIRISQSTLALVLVLTCAVAETAAQNRGAARPRASLWTVLNLPTLDGFSRPVTPEPKSPPIVHADQRSPTIAITRQPEIPSAPVPPSAPIPLPADEPKPAKRPPEPEPESATASTFSPSGSSRRSVIQKRELAHTTTARPTADFTSPSSSSAHPTPHWTPKFTAQSACFQLADDELARPVAVNMAGDLISERATAARAVKRLDPTLRISPSLIKAKLQQPNHDDAADADKSASAESDTTAQLATASPAAAR